MRSLFALSLTTVFAAGGCFDPKITDGTFGCLASGGADQCPDSYTCQPGACVGGKGGSPPPTLTDGTVATGCCVKTTGGGGGGNPTINIPKSGPPYSGPHSDPMLDTIAECPDAQAPSTLEPDDGPSTAVKFTPMPDSPTAKIVKLAICPTGPSPATGKHDVDFFMVDNSTGPASLTLMAQAFYDISYGDLDIGIYDGNMNQLVVDGTAVTNACAAASITNQTPTSSGIYYVVVAGANNVDVNKYELLIRTFAKSMPCPTM